MMNDKIKSILADEEILNQLENAPSEEEFCKILAKNGASADEINELIEQLHNTPEELSEDDLDDVAGGAPILQKALARWAYRFKHKKIFVKATHKDGVIIVTNRFGDPVSEEYLY